MAKRKAPAKKSPAPFPTRQQVLDFIAESPGPVGKREIARAFSLGSADKVRLRDLLRDLREEGLLEKDRKRVRPPGSLPNVTVIEVSSIDADGDMKARPASWETGEEPPAILISRQQGRRARHDPAVGDRLLARLTRAPDGIYRASVLKHLKAAPSTVIGVFEASDRGGSLRPTDRKQRFDVIIPAGDTGGAKTGELVRAEVLPGRGLGARSARVVEVIGDASGAGAVSLICIHRHDIPVDFSDGALDEARAARPVELGARRDLRDFPLVTIDGPDARDFDDAVWAAPDDDPQNPDGWQAVVAIADVAHYVRPGSALDHAAFERGNSVYFPDRVVPMLPPELSNDLCSLRPDEDRACMAAFLRIDRDGKLVDHRFERALMRSAARLTYTQVQEAVDGRPDDTTAPLLDPVIRPLYGAFRVLDAARQARQALEIDLPERRVDLADDGTVTAIGIRERLDSHRLIEELMIAANVAAAETLEARRQPCMYRIHEPPDAAKLEALRPILRDLGYSLPKGQTVRAANLNRILEAARGQDHEQMLNEAILRAQSQARYSPENRGHFGLALRRYAHFTSPIRRYADLLVHRALIGAGERDGIGPDVLEKFDGWGDHISTTERRAMDAERSAMDRYIAGFMAGHVGAVFDGAITSVTRFGLFVRLDDTGADGLVPMRALPDDWFGLDKSGTKLVGRHSGKVYALGDRIEVRLVEATPLAGGLLFEPTESGGRRTDSRRRRKRPQN